MAQDREEVLRRFEPRQMDDDQLQSVAEVLAGVARRNG